MAIKETMRPLLVFGAGTAGTTILPTYLGTQDKERSAKNLAVAGTVAAGASALSTTPETLLGPNLRKKLKKATGPKNYLRIKKLSPPIGATYGLVSSVLSYESGRLLAKTRDKNMLKKAGMIDIPQESLEPSIFDENQKMHPHIRAYIIELLKTIKIPLSRIAKVVMGGTLTGHQYNDNSDVDIEVFIEDPEEKWLRSARSTLVGHISHVPLKGTSNPERTIQFYVVPWNEDTRRGLYRRSFGVYDILEDEWIAPPKPVELYKDPEFEYRSDLIIGRFQNRKFVRLVDNFKEAMYAYTCYKKARYQRENWDPVVHAHKKRKAQLLAKDLADFVKEIHQNRHARYRAGWGIPRKAKANVIFKVIEYGRYGDLFELIAQKDLPENPYEIEIEELWRKIKKEI